MRVLHINNNYDGTTLHQAMMDRMDCLCDNAVFVPVHRRHSSSVKVGSNVLVSRCFHKYDRLLFAYKQRKIRRALMQWVDPGQFDLLHAYTLFTDGNVAYRLHQQFGIPYVVAVRNTDVNAFFKYRLHLRGRGIQILRNAAAVFFLSESYRKQVMQTYVPEQYRQEIQAKVHVIPNGIDEYWFTNNPVPRKLGDGCVRLVYAGAIDRNKNPMTIVKAMDILCDMGYSAELLVIGAATDQKLASKLQSCERVTCLPKMDKEELQAAYRSRDIFVMPSHHESFGLVYAEAMSQGLPVIYTRGQGFDGQFPEGMVGYSVDSHSPHEIAAAVVQICKNYAEISGNCLIQCHKFHWDALTNQYRMIYEECLK